MVINLLDNAIQAMTSHSAPEPTCDPLLIVHTRDAPPHAIVEVEDNGPGIP